MSVAAYLLGAPVVVRDGTVYAAPKGRKAWALLAYLALSDRAPTRQQLIDFLFPDAEDPAGALRWNLSELRRLLGGPDTVGSGSVVRLRLPEGSFLDVQVLMAGTSFEAVELPGLGRELLEGVEIEASPGFAAWLLGERRRLAGLGEAVLREGALRALASGNARTAVDLATRLVAAAPLDADAHALLIRACAALVHATKGKDEEGAAALHRSITAAEASGERAVAASANRELGYVELLRGDYVRAGTWFRTAEDLADDDPVELSKIHAVRGARYADAGAHDLAVEALRRSIGLAAETDQTKQEAWSTAMLGRT